MYNHGNLFGHFAIYFLGISANYLIGPGNCSASGTVKYSFPDGKSIDWNTTVYLANGATIFDSGSVSPSRSLECIKVNVTN